LREVLRPAARHRASFAHLRASTRAFAHDARSFVGPSWTRGGGRTGTVDRVRRSRLSPGELPSAYRWYDRRSGTVDLVALALESMTGVRARPVLAEAPPWIRALHLPTRLPDASLAELARLSGLACRAWVDAGRPGLEPRAPGPIR
jgi:hypothetical protein